MSKMKVLLIEPPPLWKYGNQRSKGAFGNLKTDIRWPPIDLMVIAGHLRKSGFQVSLIDGGGERLAINRLKERVWPIDPQIIILNTSTTTIFHDLSVAREIKTIKPYSLIGAIGVHVMALPEETMGLCQELDFVVFSEPEIPILNLARTLNLSSVNGICYRKNNKIFKNDSESPIKNMDDLGLPAHDLIPLDIYQEPQMKRRPLTITMVSRGCVNRCIFCSSCFYGEYRLRSVENVMQELRWITESLGVKELKFYDDGVTYNRGWAEELFTRMIEEKINLSWNTNLRADFVDFDLAKIMKKAGCHTVNVGLESANQDILNNINKNITVERLEQAVTDCKKAGLEVCGYFIIGLPGETYETIEQTIKFAKHLDLDLVTFNAATPHPGTEFYHYLEKHDYLKTKNWSKYDTNSVAVYDYPNMSGEDIYRSALRACRQFYMRPGYFWKRIRRINSWMEVKNLSKNFLAFMNNFIIKGIKSDLLVTSKAQKK